MGAGTTEVVTSCGKIASESHRSQQRRRSSSKASHLFSYACACDRMCLNCHQTIHLSHVIRSHHDCPAKQRAGERGQSSWLWSLKQRIDIVCSIAFPFDMDGSIGSLVVYQPSHVTQTQSRIESKTTIRSCEYQKKQLDNDEKSKSGRPKSKKATGYDVPYWSGLPFSLSSSTGG